MVKRRAYSPAESSSAQAKAKAEAATAAKADPLASTAPAKRRQLHSRHTDEKAHCAIQLGASVSRQPSESSAESQGLSLSHRVPEDMRAPPSQTHRLGAASWKSSRNDFGFTDARVSSQPQDARSESGDDVIAALTSCTDKSLSTPCVAPLTQLLASRSHLNRREFCSIANCMNTLAETSTDSSVQSQLWVDLLKVVTRLILWGSHVGPLEYQTLGRGL